MECTWCNLAVADGSSRHSYCTPDAVKGTQIRETRYRKHGGKLFLFIRTEDPITGSVIITALEWTGVDYSRPRHLWEKAV